MPKEANAQVLDDAASIVHGPGPSLKEVRFYKITAELKEPDEEHPSQSPTDEESESEDVDMSVDMGLRTRQQGRELGVRVEFTAEHPDWRVYLDVAAEYEADESFEASAEAMTDFAEKVGIMALYPYIREAVGNMTQRTVGVSLVLPTVALGEITFSRQE